MAIRERYWETKPGRWPEDPPVEMLTKAGADYLFKHQSPPPREAVRADSVGLRMITTKDHSDRPIYTFELPAGETKRNTWMQPFCSEGHLQLRICQTPQTPAQNARFEAEQLRIAQGLASGDFQLPEF